MNRDKDVDVELALLPYRFRTPLNMGRARPYTMRTDPKDLLASIAPDIELSSNPAKAFDQAIEYRTAGRNGLYAVAMMQAAYGGHPTASIILAGLLIHHANATTATNKRSLTARAIGWLLRVRSNEFEILFGQLDKSVAQIAKAATDARLGKITQTRQALELAKQELTVIARNLSGAELLRFSATRYDRLNFPLELKGLVTRSSKSVLLESLRYEYPWANELLNEIDLGLTLQITTNKPWFLLPPILIVGPPGVGKTRFARRLAELSGMPHTLVNVAGTTDSRDFVGTARGWISAHPSRVAESMIDFECANPIMVVDEIDKTSGNERNGHVHKSLLTMLSQETRAQYRDEGLGVELNISYVSWIFTANSVHGIEPSLRSRLRIVRLPAPSPMHAERIVETAIRNASAELGINTDYELGIEPAARHALIRAARKGATPRRTAAMVKQLVAVVKRQQFKHLN